MTHRIGALLDPPVSAARVPGVDVPIRSIIETEYGAVFEPEDIPKLVTAYEAAVRKLDVVDRKGTMASTVAKLIIGLAKEGERDPNQLCDRAVEILRK